MNFQRNFRNEKTSRNSLQALQQRHRIPHINSTHAIETHSTVDSGSSHLEVQVEQAPAQMNVKVGVDMKRIQRWVVCLEHQRYFHVAFDFWNLEDDRGDVSFPEVRRTVAAAAVKVEYFELPSCFEDILINRRKRIIVPRMGGYTHLDGGGSLGDEVLLPGCG
jgi:hypothetical protein